MAEPRTKWGQLIVEKVEGLGGRVEQLDRRLEGIAQRMDRHDEAIRDLIAEVKDIGRRSTNTAAVVRWTAGLAVAVGPLLLAGAAWLAWYTAALGKQVEHNTAAIAELRTEVREGFDRLEAALKAEAGEGPTSD